MNRDASSLGIRADWKCAKCPNVATTHQIATIEPVAGIGAVVVLDPPPGWNVRSGRAICPEHDRTRRRA